MKSSIINKIFILMFTFISISFGAQPSVDLYKTATPQYIEGDREINYRLTIVNTTNDDINVTLYDHMSLLTNEDINISVIDISNIEDQNISCVVNTHGKISELTCHDVIIPEDASVQLLYTLIAPDEGMQIENNASILDDNNDTIAEDTLTVTVFPSYDGDLGYSRDLCYLPPSIPDGGICYQSGAFIFGPDCTSNVTILRNTTTPLTNVHVFKAYSSAITWDACYANTEGNVCGQEKDLDELLNRESSLYFKEAFDEAQDFSLGDLGADTNDTLIDINTIPVTSRQDPVTGFEYIALIAQYNYDNNDSTDDTIEEYIYPCDGNYSGAPIAQVTSGGINDVNLNNVDITATNAATYLDYATYSKLGTKIVNQPFIVGVTYLDEDGNPATYAGEYGSQPVRTINAAIILQYKVNGVSNDLWAGELPPGYTHILTTESTVNDADSQNAYPVIPEAFREGTIETKLIDYANFFNDIGGFNCATSSLNSGLCLVPGCLNSVTQILEVFPLETYPHVATCSYGDGGGAAPCDSNAYYGNCGGKKVTISPAEYNNDYGCAQCLADAVAPTLSSEPFSTRPKDFSLEVSDVVPGEDDKDDGLYRAGINYPVDLNATTGTDNPSNIVEINNGTTSLGYATTLKGYYPSEVLAVIGLDQNVSLTCPDENNESQTITFTDGYSASPINYHNVGKVKLVIMDQNWTKIDQNSTSPNNAACIMDSNATDPTLDPLNLGRVGCMVKTEKPMTFVPHHFDIDANLTDHNNIDNFTYLHDINRYDDDDNYLMGASLTIDIKAMTADNNVTSNYMETCYAKETNLTLVLSGTNITYPSGQDVPLTHFLYYNPLDDNGSTDSGEGNYTLNSPVGNSISIPSLSLGNIESTFPANAVEGNGTTHIEYKLNFDRKINLVANPFRLDLSDINMTDTDDVEDLNVIIIDKNATLNYARSRASKFFYEDITDANVTTPILIDVYCDPLIVNCNDLGIDTVFGEIDEANWYISTGHTAADGNITLMVGNPLIEGTGNPTINGSTNPTPTNITIWANGADNTVNVSTNGAPVPLTVPIEIVRSSDTFTPAIYSNEWLIYNPKDPIPLSPFYKVRFIGEASWTGEGQTGHVVDINASYKKSNRLDW